MKTESLPSGNTLLQLISIIDLDGAKKDIALVSSTSPPGLPSHVLPFVAEPSRLPFQARFGPLLLPSSIEAFRLDQTPPRTLLSSTIPFSSSTSSLKALSTMDSARYIRAHNTEIKSFLIDAMGADGQGHLGPRLSGREHGARPLIFSHRPDCLFCPHPSVRLSGSTNHRSSIPTTLPKPSPSSSTPPFSHRFPSPTSPISPPCPPSRL